MVRQIAPVFFTMDLPATLAYYTGKLGFECQGTWQDPQVYAIVARDQQMIHFRCAEPPTANPDKYADELLDLRAFSARTCSLLPRFCRGRALAQLLLCDVEDADALYAEYAAQGVEFTRGLGNMPWHKREFVVKDCDGRLLAFGANL